MTGERSKSKAEPQAKDGTHGDCLQGAESGPVRGAALSQQRVRGAGCSECPGTRGSQIRGWTRDAGQPLVLLSQRSG